MSTAWTERLWAYVLDELAADERAEVERAVTRDAGLGAELADLRRIAEELAGTAPAVAPPSALRARLFAAIDAPVERFAPFFGAIAELTRLGEEKIREVLALLGTPGALAEDELAPGFDHAHFVPGGGVRYAICGLVRMAPGARFPRHRHLGPERTLVLQGVLRDLTFGAEVGPGQIYDMPEDAKHEYDAKPEAGELVFIVVVEGGIEVENADGTTTLMA